MFVLFKCLLLKSHEKLSGKVTFCRGETTLKEHNHVFGHAEEFDFWTGGQEFKDARIDIELSEIRFHRPQLTMALPLLDLSITCGL